MLRLFWCYYKLQDSYALTLSRNNQSNGIEDRQWTDFPLLPNLSINFIIFQGCYISVRGRQIDKQGYVDRPKDKFRDTRFFFAGIYARSVILHFLAMIEDCFALLKKMAFFINLCHCLSFLSYIILIFLLKCNKYQFVS